MHSDVQCDLTMKVNAVLLDPKGNATGVDHLSTEDDSKVDDALSDNPSESDECNYSESGLFRLYISIVFNLFI